MTRAMAGTMLALFAGCGAHGQTADPSPAFEVASIKPAPPMEGKGIFNLGCSGGPGSKDPGLYTCSNSGIYTLVTIAYGLKSYQLPASATPGPDLYNITAKVPPGATREQLKLMLQNLLAERFKLTFHYQKKEMQVYELVVAKGGPKLKESPPEPPPAPKEEGAEKSPQPSMPKVTFDPDGFPVVPMRPRRSSTAMANGRVREISFGVTMQQLASGTLSNEVGRPVTDATGLKGKYDFTLTWASERMGGRGASAAMPAPAEGGALAVAPDSDNGPTIFAAIQEQLGLKLELKKGTVDMFVIDHAEKMPTEN